MITPVVLKKAVYFRENKQIFEMPSLTAEMVTAAGEVEEHTVMVCQLKVIGRPLGSAN